MLLSSHKSVDCFNFNLVKPCCLVLIIQWIVLTSKITSSLNFFGSIEKMKHSPRFLEDADLTTDQLILKNNYNAENHYVTTKDGYILGVHRIANPGRTPVLLFHGLLDSSATYVIMGPENSLGYILWHNGYDVWLGNSRGNRYSKNHTSLSPKNETFWDFSFHEMGIYDLPAIIDYILFTTGFTQLHYIGHSQGTTIFFVMCTKQPNYNGKIILMQAMAPAVFVSHAKSPLIPPLSFYLTNVMKQCKGEMFPNQFLKRSPCFKRNDATFLCMEFFYWLSGHNPEQFNTTLAPIIFSHSPAGSSVKAFRHFVQLKESEKFLQYDYGQNENLKRYGTDQPPRYNLAYVTAPIVLHFGANDYLIDPVDVNQLYKELKNVQGVYRSKASRFGHADFVWSINIKSLVNQKLLRIIKQFEEGTLGYIIE